MVLPLDLRQQFLDIVQTSAGFQPKFVGSGLIRPGFRGLLNALKTGANRLIHDPAEGSAKPLGDRSRSVQNIVVDGQSRSHDGIIASLCVMSRHHFSRRTRSHAAVSGPNRRPSPEPKSRRRSPRTRDEARSAWGLTGMNPPPAYTGKRGRGQAQHTAALDEQGARAGRHADPPRLPTCTWERGTARTSRMSRVAHEQRRAIPLRFHRPTVRTLCSRG